MPPPFLARQPLRTRARRSATSSRCRSTTPRRRSRPSSAKPSASCRSTGSRTAFLTSRASDPAQEIGLSDEYLGVVCPSRLGRPTSVCHRPGSCSADTQKGRVTPRSPTGPRRARLMSRTERSWTPGRPSFARQARRWMPGFVLRAALGAGPVVRGRPIVRRSVRRPVAGGPGGGDSSVVPAVVFRELRAAEKAKRARRTVAATSASHHPVRLVEVFKPDGARLCSAHSERRGRHGFAQLEDRGDELGGQWR